MKSPEKGSARLDGEPTFARKPSDGSVGMAHTRRESSVAKDSHDASTRFHETEHGMKNISNSEGKDDNDTEDEFPLFGRTPDPSSLLIDTHPTLPPRKGELKAPPVTSFHQPEENKLVGMDDKLYTSASLSPENVLSRGRNSPIGVAASTRKNDTDRRANLTYHQAMKLTQVFKPGTILPDVTSNVKSTYVPPLKLRYEPEKKAPIERDAASDMACASVSSKENSALSRSGHAIMMREKTFEKQQATSGKVVARAPPPRANSALSRSDHEIMMREKAFEKQQATSGKAVARAPPPRKNSALSRSDHEIIMREKAFEKQQATVGKVVARAPPPRANSALSRSDHEIMMREKAFERKQATSGKVVARAPPPRANSALSRSDHEIIMREKAFEKQQATVGKVVARAPPPRANSALSRSDHGIMMREKAFERKQATSGKVVARAPPPRANSALSRSDHGIMMREKAFERKQATSGKAVARVTSLGATSAFSHSSHKVVASEIHDGKKPPTFGKSLERSSGSKIGPTRTICDARNVTQPRPMPSTSDHEIVTAHVERVTGSTSQVNTHQQPPENEIGRGSDHSRLSSEDEHNGPSRGLVLKAVRREPFVRGNIVRNNSSSLDHSTETKEAASKVARPGRCRDMVSSTSTRIDQEGTDDAIKERHKQSLLRTYRYVAPDLGESEHSNAASFADGEEFSEQATTTNGASRHQGVPSVHESTGPSGDVVDLMIREKEILRLTGQDDGPSLAPVPSSELDRGPTSPSSYLERSGNTMNGKTVMRGPHPDDQLCRSGQTGEVVHLVMREKEILRLTEGPGDGPTLARVPSNVSPLPLGGRSAGIPLTDPSKTADAADTKTTEQKIKNRLDKSAYVDHDSSSLYDVMIREEEVLKLTEKNDGPSLAQVPSGELDSSLFLEASIPMGGSAATSDRGISTGGGSGLGDEDDIEAHIGRPMIFPGAFAVIGVDGGSDDGQSAGVMSVATVEDGDETAWMGTEEIDEEVIVESAAVLEATLALEAPLALDVAVVDDEDSEAGSQKEALSRQIIRFSTMFFALAAAALITVSSAGGFSRASETPASPSNQIKGWVSLEDELFGPPIEEAQAFFGSVVALSETGDRMVVAAPGTDDGVDLNVGKLFLFDKREASNGTRYEAIEEIPGIGPKEEEDVSLAISGNGTVIAVGYPQYRGGRVQVFSQGSFRSTSDEISNDDPAVLPNSSFVQEVIFWDDSDKDGSNSQIDEDTWFGYAVDLSLDGTFLAIGIPGAATAQGNRVGVVRVFQRRYQQDKGYIWSQLGGDIPGQEQGEYFGWSVQLQQLQQPPASATGNTDTTTPGAIRVAVGSPVRDDFGGAVGVFDFDMNNNVANDSSAWQQVSATLVSSRTGSQDRFGESLALSHDGTILAVGAPGSGFGSPGYTSVFQQEENGEWVPHGNTLQGSQDGDGFGTSVSLSRDGSTLAVGVPRSGESGAGKVIVARYDGSSSWVPQGSPIPGQPSSELGSSVSLTADGTIVAGGAPSATYNNRVVSTGSVSVYERDE